MGSEYTSDDLEAVETARRLVRKYAPGDVTRTPFQIDAYTVARALLSVREKTVEEAALIARSKRYQVGLRDHFALGRDQAAKEIERAIRSLSRE